MPAVAVTAPTLVAAEDGGTVVLPGRRPRRSDAVLLGVCYGKEAHFCYCDRVTHPHDKLSTTLNDSARGHYVGGGALSCPFDYQAEVAWLTLSRDSDTCVGILWSMIEGEVTWSVVTDRFLPIYTNMTPDQAVRGAVSCLERAAAGFPPIEQHHDMLFL